MQNPIGLGKRILLRVRIKARLRLPQPLVTADLAIHPREKRKTVLDESRQHRLDLGDVLDDPANLLVVELQSLRDIIEDSDIVDDKSICLRLAVHAVRTADCLQQRVILHRLVEIHALQNRRIKARQQL